ncbi:putative PEX20 peroxisomal biogenesis factor 20 [Podospora fimiseda]|uniref:PEX20 peroxisomal biogenesis factor 20 n=1 Tax=Podospora fimiseda TaxID=252190 RepID=A0AAN7BZI7_9PEZI|nr:putative PEX20 peroxisomal biogenesis factor 20 [Podospora fimiseda]
MADSMCGPSNGAKNLLAHTDQDRSRHQDRLVQNPQAGPSTFRTINNNQASANASFEAFQAAPGLNVAAPAFAPSADFHMAVTQPMGPRAAPQYHGYHGPITGPMIAATRLESPATGGIGIHGQAQSWVSQFNSMQLNTPSQPAAPITAPANPLMQGMQLPTLTSGYRPMVPPMSQAWLDSVTTTSVTEPQQTAALPQESAEVRSAFDDLFGQYDAANEQQYAAQTVEFEAAEAAWMAEHGPTAEATRAAADLAAIQEMEAIAEEQDARKRQMDDDLARAAGDILFAVEGNASPRFKNSNFLNLMRRIALREVVVDEKSFVNARTGDEITIVMDEGPSDTVWHGEAVDAVEHQDTTIRHNH